jgi:Zn-dependent protease with chaperone function
MSETTAIYFDGLRPIPRNASLALAAKGLSLSVDDGPIFFWDYPAIRLADKRGEILRFHREQNGAHTGEVLEIELGEFSAALQARCPSLQGNSAERKQMRNRIIGWSVAALASIGLLITYGIPALANRLGPLIPWSTEVTLGNAVEDQVLAQLSGGKAPRVCTSKAESAGSKALETMVQRLTQHVTLPGKADIKILDHAMENAFTLPGGKILLMRGLIEKAQSPDEVAGVLAHELGHMVHRDAMRGLIHAGGISFVIGTLLGDFTGAGALIIGSKFLIGNRYSRENESEADRFAIEVLSKAGGDVRALGSFLARVAKVPGEKQMELLLSHPVTDDRIAEINKLAPVWQGKPILSPDEWSAVQAACKTP